MNRNAYIFFMFCAGLEVELQAAALDQAQGDDDLLIGREIVARIVFLQRDGEDDLGTLDVLPQVAFEKLRLPDLVRFAGFDRYVEPDVRRRARAAGSRAGRS